MSSESFSIAIVGATGVVGAELLKILEEKNFPAHTVTLYASSNSVGKTLAFKNNELPVQELNPKSFLESTIALFSAGSEVSLQYAPIAVASNCIVIDNSNAWRMDDRCPLVVPEVNSHALETHSGIIANPNCSTIQLLVALAPIHKAVGIKRIVVSTYQAVSGTGAKAITELEQQTRQLFNMQEPNVSVYPHRIAFNCLPHIDEFMENEYTKEELKMTNETIKILEDPTVKLTATCVRVPVFYGHAASVNIETNKKLMPRDARALLAQAPGVHVCDNPKEHLYPTPLDVTGENDTFVGRIREDFTVENGLNLWVAADNIRKGAALNAVQIAEALIQQNKLSIKNPQLFL